jgi:hypothetical protein
MKRKSAAAVEPGRKGGLKGGPPRAAVLAPEERSQSAKKAVTARWAKAKSGGNAGPARATDKQKAAKNPKLAIATDDAMLITLLSRLKATVDPTEIRQLSNQIERVVFHKQFENA